MFTYKTQYSTYKNCLFRVASYGNGNIALLIENEDEGRIAVCTVNPSVSLPDTQICIKDYSENVGMVDFLKSNGIIADKVGEIQSGWVSLPVFNLAPNWKNVIESMNLSNI